MKCFACIEIMHINAHCERQLLYVVMIWLAVYILSTNRYVIAQNDNLEIAMADTGCHSCLASMRIIQRFGLTERLNSRHYAYVCCQGINILGATILRFSGQSKSGETLKTRQITYVTSDFERLFLSREACIALKDDF